MVTFTFNGEYVLVLWPYTMKFGVIVTGQIKKCGTSKQQVKQRFCPLGDSLKAASMMNGDTEEKGIENSAISIDTKGLASRKVIQVKIDNPFLSNDDSDDDAEANNPFCIKVSKGQAEDHVTSELTNGNKSNSSVDEDKNADKSPLEAGKGPDVSEKEDILPDVISKNKEEGDFIENKSSKEGALEDDNSQCSSASRSSGKSDAGKSENNFGDVEDENSRESIKLSEKFDNEEAHELSQVVDSTVKSDNEVKSESETKDASDVIVKDSKNDMEKSCEGDVNMDSVDKTENTEEEKSTNNQYGGEKHSNKESSLKSDENLFSDVYNSGQNCDVSGDAGDEESKMDIGKEKSSEEDTNIDKTDVEKEKSYKRDIEEEGMEVDTKDDKVKEKVEENKTENAKDSDESEKVEDRNENESPKPELDKKSVDKVKDDDGTDILITVNEDNSDDESKEESEEAKNKTDSTSDIKDKDVSKTENKTRPETPKIKSVFENDVVIVDLSAESPKDDKAKPAWSTSQTPVNTTIKSMLKPIAPVPSTNQLPVTSTAGVNGAIVINGQQYVQQIMYDVNGRKQIVQVPISNANKHLYSSMLSQAALAVKTPSLQGIATAAKAAPPKPKTGLARFKDVDDNIPIASWEQLDLIKYEWSTKKYDNTFWAGQCPVNKTAELSAPTRFLMDLGSDLVKKSAYDQITKIQGMKEKAGKLGKNEQQNLDRMSSIVKELKEKLKHLDVTTHKCDGCNFVTESANVMQFHKEHPHMVPPMDPFGDLGCSFADCDFKAVKPTEFAAHMENVHKMKARVYDKPEAHRCSLCYYEAKMKNQLTKHKFKCIKQFKPNMNQSPHYTDISYCLKNIFYKYQIKRLAPPPKPATIVKATAPRNYSPLRPTILQNNKVPVSMPFSGNQPIVVNSGNLQYRPVLALNNITNQPVQLFNMPVSQAVTNSVSQPTVNELLKAKTAPKVNSNTAYSNVAPPAQKSAFEVCEICGGYVKDKMSLRIHFFYAHKVDLAPHLFNRGLPPLVL
ncbi:hypothetical protein FSP39_021355 [Pinctada imbricata]|uniref:C2H2-type domain-containing protein n=1 Tax=Pinctada imbricata TaxID=66713 RepID=A0AA88XK10_PINIB|nr:hypothetical protein FSP39_021355 [Pinctada imbricata]